MKQIKQQILFTVALLLSAITTSAYSFEVDGICYTIKTSNSCEVTYRTFLNNSYSGMITIPSKVNYNSAEYTVVGISDYAFRDCPDIISITLPNSITNIGEFAFRNCTGLNNITIPNSVKTIGQYAFSGCSRFTHISIPKNVTYIGTCAFSGCFNIVSIKVDTENKDYDSRNNCNAIIDTYYKELITGCVNAVIPSDVISIGNDAFFGCEGLSSITIPNSVRTIKSGAFNGCGGIKSITIPKGLTTIEISAFGNCM